MTDTVDAELELLRAELAEHTMYELLGGEAGVRRVIDRFYDAMDAEPRFASIRAMHAPDLGPMRQGLFEYLSGWLGGPPLFVQRTGSPCLSHAHAPFDIDEQARDLWLDCMTRALADAEIPARYGRALLPAFGGIADMLRTA